MAVIHSVLIAFFILHFFINPYLRFITFKILHLLFSDLRSVSVCLRVPACGLDLAKKCLRVHLFWFKD